MPTPTVIRQFRSICRVKELREEKLQRAVEVKRREIRDAEEALTAAERRARENEARLIRREKAIYARLLGKVSTPARFERVKEKVRRLEEEQQNFIEEVKRTRQGIHRLNDELEKLRGEHRTATIDRDKYHTTMRNLEMELRMEMDAVEELDLEELSIAKFASATR